MTDPGRVARALKVWVLCLAVAAPVLGLVGIFWILTVLTPTGVDIQIDSAYIPSQIAMIVLGSVVFAMLIAALIVWILYNVGHWRKRGQQDD